MTSSNRSILRVAVVGCGALARSIHLPNLANDPNVELQLCCDMDSAIAESAAKEFGARRAETDWQRVITADDVDVIVLATHTNLRGALILPALAAGKPVYVEKPLSNSDAEMVSILQQSRDTGVPICVGHNRRSSPAVLAMREWVQKIDAQNLRGTPPSVDRSEGKIRVPEETSANLLLRVNDDVRSWKSWIFHDQEGIIFAEMVHFIDLALWLQKSPPVRVFAEGSQRGNFSVILRHADASLTTIQHSMVGHFDYPKELFEFTKGNITLALDQHLELRQTGLADEPTVQTFPVSIDWATVDGMRGYFTALDGERQLAIKENRSPRPINPNKGHAAHLRRFLQHVRGEGENPAPVESAIITTRIALKMLQSIQLGQPIPIGPSEWHLPE